MKLAYIVGVRASLQFLGKYVVTMSGERFVILCEQGFVFPYGVTGTFWALSGALGMSFRLCWLWTLWLVVWLLRP